MRTLRVPMLLVLLAIAAPAIAGETPRRVIDLNADWRFFQGESDDASNPAFDDAAWRRLNVPHDWSIEGAFAKDAPAGGDGGFLPTGVAWYRKAFPTPDGADGKHVFVEFDGVMANSDVWLNGRHLGRRPSGYVSFRYELTPHLNRAGDEENVLVVKADTSAQPASRWYAGSGVYRPVRLVVVDPLRIVHDGVFVSTPQVSAAAAQVQCQVEVANDAGADHEVTLTTTLIDPRGAEVASKRSSQRIARDGRVTFDQQLAVPDPQRWDVGQGVLYKVVNRLETGGAVRDELTTSFGIRDMQFRADTGFWINGRNLKLKGVCLHHCAGAVGAAVPKSLWVYRLRELQKLGVNAVRTAHNPVAPEFLDLCDQLGIVVMDEFFDCWHNGKRKHDYHLFFDEWAHRDLLDTVRRDRNHPAVVLYSVGNEIRDTHRPEHAKRVLTGLVEICHDADPTRPVTQGLFRPNVTHDYDNGLADLLDVIGTNYRSLELLDAWRDDPTRKLINTEQGHDRGRWLTCRDTPQLAGQFLWVGIDYLGESRRWPLTTFDAGLLDRTGHPHPRGYERQSWWSDEPMVRAYRRVAPTALTPEDPGYEESEWKRPRVLFDDWTPAGDAGDEQLVEVYSNCASVELLLNSESLGAKPLSRDARPRQWRVPFKPGRLVAIGRDGGGETARHELRTAGPASRVELSVNRDALPPGSDEIAVVTARVLDEQGVPAVGAEHLMTFHVDGPGEIVAVDNGSPTSLESFRGIRRTTHQGRCIAIVRASAASGQLTVAATAEGLAPGEVKIPLAK